MVKLLGKKVAGEVSYGDLFGAGIVKYAEERALAGLIGNGTFKSGAIKLGIGLAAKKFLGRGLVGDSVGLGFGVDGVEDILSAALGNGAAGIGGAGNAGDNW